MFDVKFDVTKIINRICYIIYIMLNCTFRKMTCSFSLGLDASFVLWVWNNMTISYFFFFSLLHLL